MIEALKQEAATEASAHIKEIVEEANRDLHDGCVEQGHAVLLLVVFENAADSARERAEGGVEHVNILFILALDFAAEARLRRAALVVQAV